MHFGKKQTNKQTNKQTKTTLIITTGKGKQQQETTNQ